MKSRTVLTITIFIISLELATAFFPNHYNKYTGEKDYTHADITELGILQAVAEYFESTPAAPGGTTPNVGSLTGMTDLTTRKLYDKYYGQGTRSARRLQEAIDEIVRSNNKVDQDHYTEAAWHFNGEQIAEANKKLIDIRADVVKELSNSSPNYESARALIGQFFHIMQMFYSNTNWIEGSSPSIFPAIGMTGVTLLPVPGPNEDTCKNCNFPTRVCIGHTPKYIMAGKQVLTSGYKGGQDIIKPYKDPATATLGKCSHGGPTDNSSTTVAATGGINKDSADHLISPMYYRHITAAQSAIQHTSYFFSDSSNGIRTAIGDKKFKALLQITPGHSLVIIIDQSASMATDLPVIVREVTTLIQTASSGSNAPANYILVTFSDPGTSTTVKTTTQSTEIISWIGSIQPSGCLDCPEFTLTGIEAAANAANRDSIMYVFTDSTPKDPYKQETLDSLISSKRLQVFFVVTGTCSATDPNGLRLSNNLAVGMYNGRKKRDAETDMSTDEEDMKEEKESKVVLIMQRSLDVSDTPMVEIPIDNTIKEVNIEIQGATAMPYPMIRGPKNEYLNIDGNDAFETRFADNLLSITIQKPESGIWTLFRFDKTNWRVEVTGKSTLDFDYKVSHMGTTKENVSHVFEVEVETDTADYMVYNLVVSNSLGNILQKVALNKVSGTINMFQCKVEHYLQDHLIGIEGLDSDGHLFLRLHKSHSAAVLTHRSPQHAPLRHKRATTTWNLIDVYRHLGSVSGGHVFQVTQGQIPDTIGIMKSSISGAEVLVLNNIYPGGPSSPKTFEVPVDSSMSEFTLKMHWKQDIPRFTLKDQRGNIQPIDNITATMYNIGKTYISVVVKNPGEGGWTVRKSDISEWDVEVTAKSSVDFTAKLMKYDANTFTYYETNSRPIPDENVTLSIELNDKTVVKDIEYVSLLGVFGAEIAHYSLKPKITISGKGFYETTMLVPHEAFKYAIVGTTPSGGPFVRMHRDVIEPVNIKLEHIPEKVPLYKNENINVSFVVRNAGSQDEDVKVTIEDDKNFAIGAKIKTFHLKAWTNQTGYFTLQGGPTKGETTTITLTAKPATPAVTSTKYQYIITYLTVEERKIDTIPPVCNVTASPATCGNDPCTCDQHNVLVTADIWDEGDGLANITAPNTPPNSLLLNGFTTGLIKTVGIVRATLFVNCCRKNVTIEVTDLKNLTGECDIPIDPTYDVNACTTTTPSTTTASTTTTITTTPSTTTSTTTASTTPSTSTTTTASLTSTTQASTSSSAQASTLSSVQMSSSSSKQTSTQPSIASTTATSSSPQLSNSNAAQSTSNSAGVSHSSAAVTQSTTAKPSSSIPSGGSGSSGANKISTSTKSSSLAASSATAQNKNNAASTTTTTQNPTASKEENSSTLSDGAVYSIAAGVGAVTLAVVVGGIFLVSKKMATVSPKKRKNST